VYKNVKKLKSAFNYKDERRSAIVGLQLILYYCERCRQCVQFMQYW